jgi:dihydroorotate dehydrogenase electron transfer subunit
MQAVLSSGEVRRATDKSFPIADQRCHILANEWVNSRYKRLTLAAGGPALDAAPGQFFHILCTTGGDGVFLRRPMSLFRADRENGFIEFLYHVKGRGTDALAALKSGDAISVLGPLGRGFDLDPSRRRILVVARGVGLATLAPIAAWASRNGCETTAILSARTPADLMDREFAGDSGATIIPVLDSDGSSDPERVRALVRSIVDRAAPDAFFTCGSNRLLLLLQDLACTYGIPGQVALEQQMGCGLGMCFCCVRSLVVDGREVHKRVCTDGPVFDLAQAKSW